MPKQSPRPGRLLADARKRKGLTLRSVQRLVGVSNAYISQLETGKIHEPSPHILFKLSRLYKVPYGTLMKDAGYPLPEKVRQPVWATRLGARVGPISREEEDDIVAFIEILRSRKKKAARRSKQ